MTAIRTALILCLLAGCTAQGRTTKPDPEKDAKWAKGIADDFFAAVLKGDGELAAGLLSPELSKAVGEAGQYWENNHLVRSSVATQLCQHLRGYGEDCTATYRIEERSPDGTEIVFRGTLSGKDWFNNPLSEPFTIRVAKESAGGRWSIRFFSINKINPKAEEGKKE